MATDKHWTNRVLTDAEVKEIFGENRDSNYNNSRENKEITKSYWWGQKKANSLTEAEDEQNIQKALKDIKPSDSRWEPNSGMGSAKMGKADMNGPEPEHEV